VKICGATGAADLAALTGVDLVGLWHQIPGGHADLDRGRLVALAGATGGPAPVLVTFSADPDSIAGAAAAAGVGRVQLHGYQPPGLVRRLLARQPDLIVIKVLHVHAGTCQELALVPAYQRAGVSMFLLDSVTDDGRIGSTARSVEPAAALELAGRLERPFLLAGGLSAANAGRYAAVRRHPLFAGVDVDSGARDAAGRIDAGRVAAICREWTHEVTHGGTA
jgi:phosphoribosylanthranilate isomerase